MSISVRHANIVTFTVEGRGTFPFDMLRYDACFPATEMNDSHKLEWLGQPGLRQVTLKHYVPKGAYLGNYPTAERWDSFNWKVIDGSVKYDKWPT